MVTVKSNGKTYMLNKEEFREFMWRKWKAAQARKAARLDYLAEQEEKRAKGK